MARRSTRCIDVSTDTLALGLGTHLLSQYEEWDDPSGGLLSSIFEACENDSPDELAPLLEKLKGSGWGVNAIGPDGDTPL
jgi:hypothetical protein